MPPKQSTVHGFGKRKIQKADRLANLKKKSPTVSNEHTAVPLPAATPALSDSETLSHSVSCRSKTKLSHWTKSPDTNSAAGSALSGFVTVSKAHLSQLLVSCCVTKASLVK